MMMSPDELPAEESAVSVATALRDKLLTTRSDDDARASPRASVSDLLAGAPPVAFSQTSTEVVSGGGQSRLKAAAPSDLHVIKGGQLPALRTAEAEDADMTMGLRIT